jgi:hypothetical protein
VRYIFIQVRRPTRPGSEPLQATTATATEHTSRDWLVKSAAPLSSRSPLELPRYGRTNPTLKGSSILGRFHLRALPRITVPKPSATSSMHRIKSGTDHRRGSSFSAWTGCPGGAVCYFCQSSKSPAPDPPWRRDQSGSAYYRYCYCYCYCYCHISRSQKVVESANGIISYR